MWWIPIATQLFNMSVTGLQNKKARNYNSPRAQISRFRQAGISPNAIFTNANAGNYNPIPIQGMPVNWWAEQENLLSQANKASEEGREKAALANIAELTEKILTRTGDQGVTVLEKQIQAGINKDTSAAYASQAAAQDSLASANLKDEQSLTESYRRENLQADTELKKANTVLANTSVHKIENEIEQIVQAIQTDKARAEFLRENASLTRLEQAEQIRATEFARQMEPYQIREISERIRSMAREIERSELQSKGREDMIRSMMNDEGKLGFGDVVALYFYDLFSGAGGAAVSGTAGYLIGKGRSSGNRSGYPSNQSNTWK